MGNTELLKKINRTKIQKALFWNVKQCLLHAQTVPFACPNSAFCSTKVCILQTADNEAVAKQKMFCRMVTPQNGSPMAKCRACASRKWRML